MYHPQASMRTLFLLTALLCLPFSGMARGKKSANPQPVVLTKYPSADFSEYQFHRGKAVLRGRIVNAPDNRYPETFKCRTVNGVTGQDMQTLVKVSADGTFTSEIKLPHAQFVWGEFLGYIFMFPGDTIDCTFDVPTRTSGFNGDNISCEVNRILPDLKAHYFNGMENSGKAAQKSYEEVMAYRDRNVAVIDRCTAEIEAGTVPYLDACKHPFSADILKSYIFNTALINLLDTKLMYDERAVEYGHDENGRLTVTEVKDFMPIKNKEYYNFLPPRESFLLDTPMLLFDPWGNIIINRLQFGLFGDSEFEMNQITAVHTEVIDGKEEQIHSHIDLTLPTTYDHAYYKETLQERGGRIYTYADYYKDCVTHYHELTGLGNSCAMQLCRTRDLFSLMLREPSDDTPDRNAYHFAAFIPCLNNAVISHHALEAYRRYVVRNEGKVKEASSTPEADAILQRITAPYAGNVLFLDFWGIGCGPCRACMLNQRELVKEMEGRPVRFLYICNEKDSPREPSDKFLNDNYIQGEHIYLTQNEWNHLAAKFNIAAIPFQLLIDRKGNIVEKEYFHLSKVKLEQLMEQ